VDFYSEALGNRGADVEEITTRVRRIAVNDAHAVYVDLLAGGARYGASAKADAGLKARDTFIGPGIATSMVGEKYQANAGNARASVRDAWTLGEGPSEAEMNTFLTGKTIQPGRKYALLWIRLSAKTKKGGAHAELDTSLQGVRDLKAEIIAQTGREVIVVGDDPHKPDIAHNAINLLEFWNEAPFNTGTKVEKRMAQLRLFSHMIENGYDLVSIGMRSGAMEGPALLGVPTVYIENEGNRQSIRMEKWLGKVPGWTQAKVKQLPTRTGRRYQQGAVRAWQLRQRYTDATRAVDSHTNASTRSRLVNSYAADPDTFQRNFISNSLVAWQRDLPRGVNTYDDYVTKYESKHGKGWSTTLRGLLSSWHGHYETWWETDDELLTQEAAIDAGKEDEVRRTLSGLRSASDRNLGLADFFREAGVKLRRDDVPLRPALRKWRTAWTGKDVLDKGFIGEDVETILSTPKLHQDRIDKLAGELDAILGAPAGTVGLKVGEFRGRTDVQTLTQFQDALLEELRAHFAGRLGLGNDAPAPAVKPAIDEYVKSEAGQAWWLTVTTRVTTLHGLSRRA
jgi:hypothetical protein